MSKFIIDTTLNYSPNFDVKKRRQSEIKFIILHYTGMKKEKEAIEKLTNIESKVSSHYLIKNNGDILTLVPELYISWHAGVSSWKKYKSINRHSIGIEISNPGHDNNYKKFSKKQNKSILKLCSYLIKKYKINSNYILGHSDIAPDRKKDPGEKFPWKYLSKNKIGQWHNLNAKKLFNNRNQKVDEFEIHKFIKNLYKIGYPKNYLLKKYKYLKLLTIAFQRRFRPELINGKIDQECLIISNNLIKT